MYGVPTFFCNFVFAISEKEAGGTAFEVKERKL